jgi:hypothetical protein
MSAPKVVYYPAPTRSFTGEEIAETFSRHAGNDGIVMVMHFMLQQRLAQATIDSTDAKLTEREAGIVAGRIQELTNFQWQISQLLEANAERKAKKK